MARKKIPGIYMIKIIPTNKIYIGQSKDLRHRFDQYKWAATTDKKYTETKHPITKAIRDVGLANVEFIILASGSDYKDTDYRLLEEYRFITMYDACNPERGYNESIGFDKGNIKSTKQSTLTKLQRCDPVYLYNTETQSIMYYIGGAKSVGKDLGYNKDRMSHTVNRGLWLEHKYYIFFVDPSMREKIYEKLRKQKTENFNMPIKSQHKSARGFKRYKEAYEYVTKIACDVYHVK